MTIEELRRVARAEPFQPFDICLTDGRALPINHPEFLGFAPVGRIISVGLADGTIEIVDSILIVSLRPRKNGARRRKT